MPKFRTGTDDFRELINDGGTFVDKSLLIKDVIDGNKVTLLPRPRRFGKTLNMTMLRYFFEKSDENRAPLFNGLAITEDAEAWAHQGQYPVIYLSLKDVKGTDWETAEKRLKDKIADLFIRAAIDLDRLAEKDRKDVEALSVRKADSDQLRSSLNKLIELLFAQHEQPVVVLIDEYDSPVIDAWQHGYYDEMMIFLRSWLGDGLKHENAQALYRAVITGILRVAKESLFSGLNNLHVASMLKPGPFANKFGFTQPELDQVLVDFDLPQLAEPMQQWYNGYDFGGHTIYNPWSVICCIQDHPAPVGPQWLNTASNTLVYEELDAGGLELKADLEKLLNGEELRYPIVESTVFDDIGRNRENIWSFLYFSGYLKASDPQEDLRGRLCYKLDIPNREILLAFQKFVDRMFIPSRGGVDSFLDCFTDPAQLSQLELILQELVSNLISCHDVARYPEAVYHAFMLGLLANLRIIYEIRSNPEAGYGRAGIVMRPKSPNYPLAYVIELKSIPADANLDSAAQSALQQIEERAYAAQLLEASVQPQHLRKLAIIVSGKRVKVEVRTET